MNHRSLLLPAALLWIVVIGCSESKHPELRSVTGTVTYQGEPVEDAVVAFHNDQAARLASGKTNSNGEFSLTSFDANDGALPGEHHVVITKIESSNADEPPSLSMDEALTTRPQRTKKARNLLPQKYASKSTTTLIVKVTEDGPNDLEIVLED